MSKDVHETALARIRSRLEVIERSENWLAQKAGIPQGTLNGQIRKKAFSVDVLAAIAPHLGVPISYLLGEDTEASTGTLAVEAIGEIAEIVGRFVPGFGSTAPDADAEEVDRDRLKGELQQLGELPQPAEPNRPAVSGDPHT